MRVIAKGVLLTTFVLISAAASAQSADDIIEKGIVASGGREALAKLTSQATTGTMTVSTPGGEITGTIEVLNQAPNKVQTLITLDLSAVGAGTMTIDQRFDGTNGYATNSMQGETPVTSSQLDIWRNTIFPSPFLDYKERGTKIELTGKEKIGNTDVYALLITPAKGPTTRLWMDATTYQPVKSLTTVETAEMGPVEQTMALSDFRDVDGIKVPFKLVGSSSVQTFTVVVTKVEHNVNVDPARFAQEPADGRYARRSPMMVPIG
jgi:outer membrane lipoprotein-sorting protein